MTKRLLFVVLSAPALMLAQAPTTSATSAPANPISTSQSKMYTMLSGVVISAAEKMPEANYSFKPAADVRTFGQLVGHLADSQYYFCPSAAGENAPAGDIEKSKMG